GRVRVERHQHTPDRVFDELLIVGLLDIIGADARQHLAEQVELGIEVGVWVGCRLAPGEPGHHRASCEHSERRKRPEPVIRFADHHELLGTSGWVQIWTPTAKCHTTSYSSWPKCQCDK